MDNIFPGYMQIPAPATDTEGVQWKTMVGRLGVPDNVVLPNPDEFDQLVGWNARVNRDITWRAPRPDDIWQTPTETVAWHAGSCMDIALLKLALLLRAGVDWKNVAVVIGEIRAMPQNLQHAWTLLSLYDSYFVLDSKFDQLIHPAEYVNWTPLKMLWGGACVLFSPTTVLNTGQEKSPTA